MVEAIIQLFIALTLSVAPTTDSDQENVPAPETQTTEETTNGKIGDGDWDPNEP